MPSPTTWHTSDRGRDALAPVFTPVDATRWRRPYCRIGDACSIAQVALLRNTPLHDPADQRLQVTAEITSWIMFMALGLALAARAFGYETTGG